MTWIEKAVAVAPCADGAELQSTLLDPSVIEMLLCVDVELLEKELIEARFALPSETNPTQIGLPVVINETDRLVTSVALPLVLEKFPLLALIATPPVGAGVVVGAGLWSVLGAIFDSVTAWDTIFAVVTLPSGTAKLPRASLIG